MCFELVIQSPWSQATPISDCPLVVVVVVVVVTAGRRSQRSRTPINLSRHTLNPGLCTVEWNHPNDSPVGTTTVVTIKVRSMQRENESESLSHVLSLTHSCSSSPVVVITTT